MNIWIRLVSCGLVIVLGGLWAGWLGVRHMEGRASPLDRVETVFLDFRFLIRGARPAPANVAVLAIDDAALAMGMAYPLKRSDLARLVTKAVETGARAVAIDILLLEETGLAADGRLVDALRSVPSVIAKAGIFGEGDWTGNALPATARELAPAGLFAQVAKVGLVNVASDAGGTPRHIPLVFKTRSGLEPSFVLQAIDAFRGTPASLTGSGLRVAETEIPLDLAWHLPLNYYGKRGTVQTISADDILDPNAQPELLANKLVLIGATATGVGDVFATPFDPVLPGVEVLATGVSNLLDGSFLKRDQQVRKDDVLVALGLTLLGTIVFAILPLALASLLSALVFVLWLGFVVMMFADGYWYSVAMPLAASLPAIFIMLVLRQGQERLHMRRLDRAQRELGRFQARVLAERIAADPTFLMQPREQTVVVLFIDLSGYTGLSERFGPARTREFLKAFHTLVVDAANLRGGVVLDFMGDGAMIGFGIPDPTPGDAASALRCALDLVRDVENWDAAQGQASLRVGGHMGRAVLSRLGHEAQQQIAVTGDCVNVASRLMEVGKEHRSPITVSADLMRHVGETGDPGLSQSRCERVSIRGRKEEIDVVFLQPTRPEREA